MEDKNFSLSQIREAMFSVIMYEGIQSDFKDFKGSLKEAMAIYANLCLSDNPSASKDEILEVVRKFQDQFSEYVLEKVSMAAKLGKEEEAK